MDAKRNATANAAANHPANGSARFDPRLALPLAAALAAGLLLALAESPATAQVQAGVPAAPAMLAQAAPADAGAAIDIGGPPADPGLSIMAPGDFDWHPERSLAGDVVIVVSLPQQLVHVYRGGVRIAQSTISSGRPGRDTPTGVFTILQKQKMHHSTLYDDAPMPFMQRLTWDGVAMHAGHLPGYPASHGCIRLPKEFAELLYGVTDNGGVVVVADDATFADDIVRPGDTAPADLLALEQHPDDAVDGAIAASDDGDPALHAGAAGVGAAATPR